MENPDSSPAPGRNKPALNPASAPAPKSASTPPPPPPPAALRSRPPVAPAAESKPVTAPPAAAAIPQPAAAPDALTRAKLLYNQLFPVGSPRRKSGPFVVGGLVLVLLLLGKCAVSSVGNKLSAASQARAEEKRVQTTGVLLVKSNWPDATVEAAQIAPAREPTTESAKGALGQSLANLKPGKYAVTLRAEGWPDARAEVDVPAGKQAEFTVNFKGGSLRLESDPTGVSVKLGEKLLGKTPLVIPLLPPGEVPLMLEYPAWPALAYKAAITEGQEATATVRLPHGKMIVESIPMGAAVSQGRQPLGQTPLTIDRMPVGTRKLIFQAKDFPAAEVTFTVVDGETLTLRPALGLAFPPLDPAELLRTVWMPDESRVPRATAGIYKPKNDIVKNINREMLYTRFFNKIFRYSGQIKGHDPATGRLEFVEQRSDLARYRVIAHLKPGADPGVAKDATVALHGRLVGLEEPAWPGRVITLELTDAAFLPGSPP